LLTYQIPTQIIIKLRWTQEIGQVVKVESCP
jgi:hypothetical protein